MYVIFVLTWFCFVLFKGRRAEAEHEISPISVATAGLHITAASSTENPTTDETEEVVSEEQKEPVLEDEGPVSLGNSATEEMSSPTHVTCLTVQPNRVLCGVRLK